MSTSEGHHGAQRRLFLDAYALIASTISSAAAGIVTYLLSARLFPDDVVGTAAAMTAALLLLSGIAQLDLTNVLHRFLPTSSSSAKRLIYGSYLVSGLLSILLATGFVAFFGQSIFGDDRGWALLWFSASVAIWSIFNLQDQALMGLGAAWLVPVENTLHGLARIGLLLAFVGGPAVAIFSTWILPTVVLVIVVSVLMTMKVLPNHRARLGERDEPWTLRQISGFAAGGYLGSITGLLLGNILPILVIAHLGQSANAYFYMAWTVASTVDLVALNFGASLVVQGASHREHIPQLLRSALRKQATFLVPALILLAVFAHFVLNLGFGRAYADASSTMLTLLAIGLIPRLLWGVYVPAVRLTGKIKAIAASQSLSNLAVLGATITGLYLGGLTGIGIGYLAAQIVIAVVVFPLLVPLMRNRTGTVAA